MTCTVGITAEDEEKMWQSKALGSDNPHTLVSTLVYLNCKNFGIKSGREHRALRPSHITFGVRDGVEFIRYYAENFKSKKKAFIEIIIPENVQMPERCHLKLCKLYLSKCPKLTDFFYAVTLVTWSASGHWYNSSPLGHNNLYKVSRELSGSIISSLCMACQNNIGVPNSLEEMRVEFGK